jgi:hypothetical protein
VNDETPESRKSNSTSPWKLLTVSVLIVLAGLLAGAATFVFRSGEVTLPVALEPIVSGTSALEPNSRSIEPARVRTKGAKLQIADAILETEKRLKETEREYSKYAGGAIHSVLGLTAAIEKQTLEMLKQREASWTFGIGLTYKVDGNVYPFQKDTNEPLADLEVEINRVKDEIRAAEKEAANYSGGVLGATSRFTASVNRQTLAMLEQKRAALRFGLPQYVDFGNQYSPNAITSSGSAGAQPQTRPKPKLNEKDWSAVSIRARVTEKNDLWWRYAWRLTIENKGAGDHVLNAAIEFQDDEGFIVATDYASGLLVKAGTQQTFTGERLIRVPSAQSVTAPVAKVELIR